MIFSRRSRFAELIERQLDLFEGEQGSLLRACDEAERAYDRAERAEAEERYGAYLDLVETGADALAALRDAYAKTLGDSAAAEYERAFNAAVLKRFPRFALAIEET